MHVAIAAGVALLTLTLASTHTPPPTEIQAWAIVLALAFGPTSLAPPLGATTARGQANLGISSGALI